MKLKLLLFSLVFGGLVLAGPGITYPPLRVQDEGTTLTVRPILNFVGTNITCADDTTRTTCTLSGSTSPLTTKGDIYTRDSSSDTRLPVGADGLCLVSDSTTSTGLKWASCSSGGGLTFGEVQRLVFMGQ
jgi:hypothetical protein